MVQGNDEREVKDMNGHTMHRNQKRIARSIGGLSFLLLAGAIILAFLNRNVFIEQVGSDEFGFILVTFGFNAIVSIVLALLILSRHPGHRVGWLFLAIGFFFSWFAISFMIAGLYNMEIKAIPVLILPVVYIGVLLYLLPLMLSFGLVPLYFPDGRLPSPRWRPVLVIVWIGIIGQTLAQGLLDAQEDIQQLNFPGAEPILTVLLEITSFILIIGILGSLASLVVRFVRSRGEERTRMKWLVYTAVMSISIVLLLSITLGEDSRILSILASGVPTYLTVAIGIAILRHRLFDIDIIIRRTLSYAVLTAVLGLVYFGGIVLLQNVAGGLFGSTESPLIIVISTLAIAALFNPLRARIQEFIDRRFFRSKYNAEKTLVDFAAVARDEVDMVRLSDSLLSVIEKTIQPEQISLWLRETKRDE